MLRNWRTDPFDGTDNWAPIVGELHRVSAQVELGWNGIRLTEHPRNNSSLQITVITESSGDPHPLFETTNPNPGPDEFVVDYTLRTGLIKFHSTALNLIVQVDYEGGGAIDSIQNYLQLLSVGRSVPGNFQWHFTHFAGSKSLAEMQSRGWVILDGTTVESQLVDSGYFSSDDLAITGSLPNMIDPFVGRDGAFVRAGLTTGVLQEDQSQNHTHTATTNAKANATNPSGPGYSGGGTDMVTGTVVVSPPSANGEGTPRLGAETQPVNISAIPLLFCVFSATDVVTHVTDSAVVTYGMEANSDLGNPNTHVIFSAGACPDSTFTSIIVATGMTKRLDQAFVPGTGNGGRFPGSISNGTWHSFAIVKDSDGSVDWGFDDNPTAANIPAGYTKYRRRASFVRAAGAILPFVQDGDEFLLITPVRDINDSSPGTSAVTRTMASIPTGIIVHAIVNSTDVGGEIYYSSLDTTDMIPSVSVAPLMTSGVSGGNRLAVKVIIKTNTLAQFRSRQLSNAQLYIVAIGWIDARKD